MSVRCHDTSPERRKTPLLCAFVPEGSGRALGLEKKTDAQISRAIKQSIREIEGKLGKTSVINTLGRLPAERIMLAGLGEKVTGDAFRFAAGRIALEAKRIGVSEFSIIVPGGGREYDRFASVQQIVEGAKMSLSAFDAYKSGGGGGGGGAGKTRG